MRTTGITLTASPAMQIALADHPALAGPGPVRHGLSAIAVTFDPAPEAGHLALTLVEGRPADVIDLALALPVGPELAWTGPAGDHPPLHPGVDLAQGLSQLLWQAVDRVRALAQPVIADGNADAVHDLRVALRRLRTGLGLLPKAWADDDLAVLRAELKAVSVTLGALRDCDVTIARVADAPAALRAHLAGRRAALLAAVRPLLAGTSFQRLLLSLARWIETRAPSAPAPLVTMAAKRLDRWWRQIRHAARHIDRLPPEDLHALRKRAKTLRYATEALGDAFAHHAKARARFAKGLARVQDHLGAVHDIDTPPPEPGTDGDAIAAAGMAALLHEALMPGPGHRAHHVRAARKAIRRLKQDPRWWRDG
ncbi:MAG: hypothetical protein RIS94_2583 [Pseudomonadota bacterium]|jgi:CHAD domain-containing protein